jgi:hypothetical protein
MTKSTNGEYPLGWWKCTKSIFKGFKVDSFYECRLDLTGGPRIYTGDPTCSWAPYWQDSQGKFCYPRSELDFKFVSRDKPLIDTKQVSISLEGYDLSSTYEIYLNGKLFIRGVEND